MGGAIKFVSRDGKRLTPWMLYQINRLDADLRRLFGVGVIVSDGLRLAQEQEKIWNDRMATAGNVRGRRVYETRWWDGRLWYRISPLGTVAPPRTSNHEIQGSDGAVDIRDTGADAGITVKNSKRGQWIRQHAHEYDLVAEGDNFREGWHFKARNIFNAVPAAAGGNSTIKPKGITVKHYHRQDATARKSGRTLEPGDAFWLHTTAGAAPSQATNIAGGIGPYSITTHVYAEGTPGDSLDVILYWDDTKTTGPHSGHYVERMVFDRHGTIKRSVTSQRAVAKGYAVYARLIADADNKGSAKVTVLDSDAYLYI